MTFFAPFPLSTLKITNINPKVSSTSNRNVRGTSITVAVMP